MSFHKTLKGVAGDIFKDLKSLSALSKDPALRRELEASSSEWFMNQIMNITGASSSKPMSIKKEINAMLKDGMMDDLSHANKRSFERIKKSVFAQMEKSDGFELTKQGHKESNLEFVMRQGSVNSPFGLNIEREKEKLNIFPKDPNSRKKEDRDDMGIVRLAKTYADIGGMYMYYYDAKTKDKLKYYDTFPLILMIDYAPKGFYGLNLHYVPPEIRSEIIKKIVDNSRIYHSDSVMYQMNYDFLQSLSLSYIKPCFKRYLFSQVRTQMFEVPPESWSKAVYLPSSAFVSHQGGKSTAVSNTTVWNDSMGGR